jgi:hypothetical protein
MGALDLEFDNRDKPLGTPNINGGAIIDHKAPRERRFVAVKK